MNLSTILPIVALLILLISGCSNIPTPPEVITKQVIVSVPCKTSIIDRPVIAIDSFEAKSTSDVNGFEYVRVLETSLLQYESYVTLLKAANLACQ